MQNQGPVHLSGPVFRPRSAVDYWEDALHTSATAAAKKDGPDGPKDNRWIVLPDPSSNVEKVRLENFFKSFGGFFCFVLLRLLEIFEFFLDFLLALVQAKNNVCSLKDFPNNKGVACIAQS